MSVSLLLSAFSFPRSWGWHTLAGERCSLVGRQAVAVSHRARHRVGPCRTASLEGKLVIYSSNKMRGKRLELFKCSFKLFLFGSRARNDQKTTLSIRCGAPPIALQDDGS